MPRVDLISPFTPEDCADRLQAAMGPFSEVEGRVETGWVRLRKKIFIRNSFQTFLHATLAPCGTGTRLRGTLGVHPVVKGFMGVWFGGLGLFGVIGVIKGAPPLPGLLMLSGMIVFGVVMIWFCRFMARGEERLLMEFVTSTLEAEPATNVPVK